MSGGTRTVKIDNAEWVMFIKKHGAWTSQNNIDTSTVIRAEWVVNAQKFLFTVKCDKCKGVMRDHTYFEAGVLRALEVHRNFHS